MAWLIGFLGVGIWITYLACGLLIAKRFAEGSARLRAVYWILPVVVASLSVSALSLLGDYSKAPLSSKGWLYLVAAMALVGYLVQCMVRMYIFKCGTCGVTLSTYRTAWRRGIYTCPNCWRRYFKGVAGPG